MTDRSAKMDESGLYTDHNVERRNQPSQLVEIINLIRIEARDFSVNERRNVVDLRFRVSILKADEVKAFVLKYRAPLRQRDRAPRLVSPIRSAAPRNSNFQSAPEAPKPGFPVRRGVVVDAQVRCTSSKIGC